MMIHRSNRSTVKVNDLREHVNHMLSASTCGPEVREGMIAVLDEVLHATNSYSGYVYLDRNNVPNGHLPGINSDIESDDYEDRFRETDKTRRFYLP